MLSVCVASLLVMPNVFAQSSTKSDNPPSANSNAPSSGSDHRQWANDARTAINAQDYETALMAAKKIAASSASLDYQLLAADTMLRCGDAHHAIVQFEKYLDKRPADRPHLWQLGIALYFDGKFKEGAELFEKHREVNPNDVENAAWHFLCVAKGDSPEKAKQMLLPAPDDFRPPMKEVLEMLKSGDTAPVKERMTSFGDNESRAKSAQFYGDFYLGLYADALGDKATAQKHLDAAAKDSPRNYMGDVAKVYSRYLKK